MKVVLTHLWPESNSGDYAIVRGTMDAIEEASATPVQFTGLTTFAVHSERLRTHFPETLNKGVALKPALIASYKNDDCEQFNRREKILLSLRYVAIMLLLYVGLTSVAKYLISPDRREILRHIAEADLVVVKGGAFFMGFPGIAGTLYLLRNSLTAMWCARLNRNCVIAPHSFGPFANFLQRLLLRVMLKNIVIYVREKISLRLLEDIGISATYLPDMAFYLGLQPGNMKCERKISVTARPCPTFLPIEQQQSYYENLALITAALLDEGYEIVFVPQVSGPDHREDDRKAIEAIYQLLLTSKTVIDKAVTVADPLTLADKLQIYGESVCCIGTRMHSVIFSCLTSTKVVALAYLGPKHQGIMNELNLGNFVLDISNLTFENAIKLIRNALSDQDTKKTAQEIIRLKALIEEEFVRLVGRVGFAKKMA